MNIKYVKIQMIKHNLNVKEIAKLLNVNINTISRWTNGKNTANIEIFIKLINLLELDTNKLLEKKE
jgi:transcriptional regulator with XRE-family HTH domain